MLLCFQTLLLYTSFSLLRLYRKLWADNVWRRGKAFFRLWHFGLKISILFLPAPGRYPSPNDSSYFPSTSEVMILCGEVTGNYSLSLSLCGKVTFPIPLFIFGMGWRHSHSPVQILSLDRLSWKEEGQFRVFFPCHSPPTLVSILLGVEAASIPCHHWGRRGRTHHLSIAYHHAYHCWEAHAPYDSFPIFRRNLPSCLAFSHLLL